MRMAEAVMNGRQQFGQDKRRSNARLLGLWARVFSRSGQDTASELCGWEIQRMLPWVEGKEVMVIDDLTDNHHPRPKQETDS
jgi:hypothetical protein